MNKPRKNPRVTIERGTRYQIYTLDGRYYVDLDNIITHSYATYSAAREALQYAGVLPDLD